MASERVAVRALLSDTQCVLLMQMAFPWQDGLVWVAPGGGLLPGESAHTALLRELHEETGRGDFEIGPEVYARTIELSQPGGTMFLHERYFYVPTQRFSPWTTALDEDERGWFRGFRWIPIAELATDSTIEAGRELHAALATL